MHRRWLQFGSVPNHYMNEFWFIVNWTPRNKTLLGCVEMKSDKFDPTEIRALVWDEYVISYR